MKDRYIIIVHDIGDKPPPIERVLAHWSAERCIVRYTVVLPLVVVQVGSSFVLALSGASADGILLSVLVLGLVMLWLLGADVRTTRKNLLSNKE
jgi:hypothetical protein